MQITVWHRLPIFVKFGLMCFNQNPINTIIRVFIKIPHFTIRCTSKWKWRLSPVILPLLRTLSTSIWNPLPTINARTLNGRMGIERVKRAPGRTCPFCPIFPIWALRILRKCFCQISVLVWKVFTTLRLSIFSMRSRT